jgi:hypothetical protein
MRRMARAGAVLLTACAVATATPVLADAARADAPNQQPPGSRPAFTVNGRATPVREVIADLVTLARNGQLGVVAVNDEGDRVPVPGVIATWVTKVIHAAVISGELERRGVAINAGHRVLARRFERHAYGAAVWQAFPRRFQARQIERTAGAIALAQDEGLDLTKRRQTRRAVVALVTELARHASVTVAPRLGTWNPDLAVVVPPQNGPAS